MYIEDLYKRHIRLDVLILQTPSSKLNIFIEDKLKSRFKAKGETVIDIDSKDTLKYVKELQGILPPIGEKWFIRVDLSKFRDKELFKTIRESTTCFFLLYSDKYKNFKLARDMLKNRENVYEYYVRALKRRDLVYLYDTFTKKDNQLSKVLFDYLAQSYSEDVEAIMDLLLELNQGTKVTSRTDISKICGIGNNSVESFIFQMVKGLSGSEVGLKTVMRIRIKAGLDLGQALGYSTFYNFMNKAIKCLVDIKVLVISGVIYKEIRDLPDAYDEKALSRYQKYLWKLKEIPLSRFLRLRQVMGNKVWRTEYDFLNFLYRYYSEEVLLGDTELQQKGVHAQ
jgi:hypothetical protein